MPGAYLKWAQWRGHNISATKVYEREALPDNVDDIDFLIVMGGPQSPDETGRHSRITTPNPSCA